MQTVLHTMTTVEATAAGVLTILHSVVHRIRRVSNVGVVVATRFDIQLHGGSSGSRSRVLFDWLKTVVEPATCEKCDR